MPSRRDPPKCHKHYSPEVQQAVMHFQDMWAVYTNSTFYELKENDYRVVAVQTAFNQLVRARKRETGTGFYLTSEEYKNGNSR